MGIHKEKPFCAADRERLGRAFQNQFFLKHKPSLA